MHLILWFCPISFQLTQDDCEPRGIKRALPSPIALPDSSSSFFFPWPPDPIIPLRVCFCSKQGVAWRISGSLARSAPGLRRGPQARRPRAWGGRGRGSRTYSTAARSVALAGGPPQGRPASFRCFSRASAAGPAPAQRILCYWSIRQPRLQRRGLGPGPFQQEAHCVDSVHLGGRPWSGGCAQRPRPRPACALGRRGWGLWPDPCTWAEIHGRHWSHWCRQWLPPAWGSRPWPARSLHLCSQISLQFPAFGPEGQNEGNPLRAILWEGAVLQASKLGWQGESGNGEWEKWGHHLLTLPKPYGLMGREGAGHNITYLAQLLWRSSKTTDTKIAHQKQSSI